METGPGRRVPSTAAYERALRRSRTVGLGTGVALTTAAIVLGIAALLAAYVGVRVSRHRKRLDRLHAARHRVLDRKDERSLTRAEQAQLDAIHAAIDVEGRRALAYARRVDPIWPRLHALTLRVGDAIAPAPHWIDEWRIP